MFYGFAIKGSPVDTIDADDWILGGESSSLADAKAEGLKSFAQGVQRKWSDALYLYVYTLPFAMEGETIETVRDRAGTFILCKSEIVSAKEDLDEEDEGREEWENLFRMSYGEDPYLDR